MGAALLSRGLAENGPRAGDGPGRGPGGGGESDGGGDGTEVEQEAEEEEDTFDAGAGVGVGNKSRSKSAKQLGAFESLAEVRGDKARGSVVARTTAEAVEMQKCLQLRLQKKNSKSKVMHGARVRTAFSAERSEFSVAARAASAAASPADVLQAPPPLPRRDSAYRKLVQRVLLAGAEEAGGGECH